MITTTWHFALDTLTEMQSLHEKGSVKWAKIEIVKNTITAAFEVADSISKGTFDTVVESIARLGNMNHNTVAMAAGSRFAAGGVTEGNTKL